MSMSNLLRNRRPWLRVLRLFALVLVIAATVVAGWMAYSGVSTSLRAEKNLQATRFAIRLVDQFVSDKGRWPQSWQELKELQFPGPHPSPVNSGLVGWSSDWPTDLQECVAIDFRADAAAVAQQDPMTFDAIKPIGPCYPYADFVSTLQQTLKKTIKRNDQQGSQLSEEAASALTKVNRLIFPEEVERAMLLEAWTTNEQVRRMGINPLDLRGPVEPKDAPPPAHQAPPPTATGR
jgi:type II secretory pathway pseudopilin PulG